SFFAGQFFIPSRIPQILEGLVAFCFYASAIYIINDNRDIEEDRKHPVKSKRPLASGKVKKPVAVAICITLLILGSFLGWLPARGFLSCFILALFFLSTLFFPFDFKILASLISLFFLRVS